MKKWLASLLAVVMVIAMLPTVVFANTTDSVENTTEAGVDCNLGDTCEHAASVTTADGTKHYADVQEAINAAASNGTVEIINNVTLNNTSP